MSLPNLPLLHDGDSFLLLLADEGRSIRLTAIQRFENNINSEPMEVKFFSLDETTRHAVLQQIRRRYPGRTILV